MNSDLKKVAILFGGRSTEHAISLLSARNVISSLDKDKYVPVLIGIDKKGQWHYRRDAISMLGSTPEDLLPPDLNNPVLLSQNADAKALYSPSGEQVQNIDVIFPVLHGTYGEDGSIQGLAKLANIPCVGLWHSGISSRHGQRHNEAGAQLARHLRG